MTVAQRKVEIPLAEIVDRIDDPVPAPPSRTGAGKPRRRDPGPPKKLGAATARPAEVDTADTAVDPRVQRAQQAAAAARARTARIREAKEQIARGSASITIVEAPSSAPIARTPAAQTPLGLPLAEIGRISRIRFRPLQRVVGEQPAPGIVPTLASETDAPRAGRREPAAPTPQRPVQAPWPGGVLRPPAPAVARPARAPRVAGPPPPKVAEKPGPAQPPRPVVADSGRASNAGPSPPARAAAADGKEIAGNLADLFADARAILARSARTLPERRPPPERPVPAAGRPAVVEPETSPMASPARVAPTSPAARAMPAAPAVAPAPPAPAAPAVPVVRTSRPLPPTTTAPAAAEAPAIDAEQAEDSQPSGGDAHGGRFAKTKAEAARFRAETKGDEPWSHVVPKPTVSQTGDEPGGGRRWAFWSRTKD